MKTLLIWVLPFVMVWGTCGQGTVRFSNREISPRIDEPFYDVDGTTRLDGPNFLAALYYAPDGFSADAMVQVGPAQAFRSGTLAGYWTPANRTLPLVTPEQPVLLQVRFWDSQSNTLSSFEQAYAANAKVGFSAVLRLTPPSPLQTTYLTGLKSASLIPVLPPLALGETRTNMDVMAVPNGLQLNPLCSQPVGRLRWFHLTFANPGETVIQTEGSSIDTVLSVFTSCLLSANACAPVACSDDRAPGQTASEVRFQAHTNVKYAVAVGGQNGATGALHVTFSMPVALRAQRTADKKLEISWPVEASAYSLEGTTNTAAPFVWDSVPATPAVENHRNVVRLPPSAASAFYRLKRNALR